MPHFYQHPVQGNLGFSLSLFQVSPLSGSKLMPTFPGYAAPGFQYKDVDLLSIAAVRDGRRQSNLKWHPFITSHFCRSEALATLTGSPLRVSGA